MQLRSVEFRRNQSAWFVFPATRQLTKVDSMAKPLGGKDLSPFPFFVILVSLTVHFQK